MTAEARARGDFAELLTAAAQQLRVPPGLVEKDYWITQLLRRLRDRHYGQFLLKGGTSLSKGYGLIDRFSEDVDLLLVPGQSDRHDGAVAQLLATMEDTIADAVGGQVHEEQADEGVARVLSVTFAAVVPTAAGLDPSIRVDYGVGGGTMPQDEVEITTLLGAALAATGRDPDLFDDLSPFRLSVLHPARTLIEKMCLVHGIATRILEGNPHVRSRMVRHYYDLYHLLDPDRSPALDWIARQGDIGPVITDCLRITRAHFGEILEPPDQLAGSPAFTDAKVLDAVGRAYPRMLDTLAFPGRAHPTLAQVIERVRQSADLL